jgi:Transposase DDE domain
LAECGTHAVVAAVLGPCTTGEGALADQLLEVPGRLGPELLVLADRGLWSADRWRRAAPSGAALVWRVKTGPTGPGLAAERVLADGSWLARLTAGKGDPVLVRVLEYRLDDQGRQPRGGHGSHGGATTSGQPILYRLITSILDPEAAPAVELAALYHQRWEIETTLDELKVHQRGPGAVLRSETPDGVRQEVGAHLLVHDALRASCTTPPSPTTWTLTSCRSPAPCGSCAATPSPGRSFPPDRLAMAIGLAAAEILSERLPPRRLRAFPRVVKRKMSNYHLKRAHHRPWPQPTRPAADTVVIQPIPAK